MKEIIIRDPIGFFDAASGEFWRIPQRLRKKARSLLWRATGNLTHYRQCAMGWSARHERGISGAAGDVFGRRAS